MPPSPRLRPRVGCVSFATSPITVGCGRSPTDRSSREMDGRRPGHDRFPFSTAAPSAANTDAANLNTAYISSTSSDIAISSADGRAPEASSLNAIPSSIPPTGRIGQDPTATRNIPISPAGRPRPRPACRPESAPPYAGRDISDAHTHSASHSVTLDKIWGGTEASPPTLQRNATPTRGRSSPSHLPGTEGSWYVRT